MPKTNAQWLEEGQSCVMNTYGRLPVCMVRGQGVMVYDADGKEYMDFVAGIAVNALGHCHPKVVQAIKDQAETLIHCSNLYWISSQIALAKLLTEHSDFDKVFFCNSGAEANEGAIKLARKYAKYIGHPERYEIISMEKSFHGRTLATLTATGQEKVQKGFSPLPSGFTYVPFNDIAALKAAVSDRTCAIMLEPVQGEGGVIPASDAYMQAIRQLCDERDILLLVDEIQTGLGRTGKLFGYQHSGVTPDIMSLAKALGGGAPVGAFLATDKVAAAFGPGDHGSTFGGNPLVTAAGVAAFTTILEENLPQHAAEMGQYMQEKFLMLQKKHTCIQEVRGRGLLLGLLLDREGAAVVQECMANGLLINCTAQYVLRFVPPLIITKADIDRAVAILDAAFTKVYRA